MTPPAGPGGAPWADGREPWAQLRPTHSGAVLLWGDRAYKLKLPVRLGFLDFSTPEARSQACRRELVLNRRLAPDVYLGLGGLEEPGGGREPVVVMTRLPASTRLATLVREGVDVSAPVVDLARLLAGFHAGAHRGPEVDREGTRDAIRDRWEASFQQVCAAPHPGLDADVLDEVERLVRAFLEGRSALFDARVGSHRVVDGHGDLLAEDIFCLEDGPRVLDCLDFDDRLRRLDQLDDVCCLAMDLERLGDPGAAALLVRAYAEHSADPAPGSLVHHFTAYRAFVRVKVGCLRGAVADPDEVAATARLCLDHLRAGAVRLVLVGGPPGTGKTTLSGDLADRCGFVALNSDRVRKELAGLDPEAPAPAAYGAGLYDPDATDRTYTELLRRAGALLERGESVVLDATWGDPRHREEAHRLAARVRAELVPVRCALPLSTAQERVAGRTGPSDADAAMAARVRRRWAPWPAAYAVDTRQDRQTCAARAATLAVHHTAAALAPPA